MKKRNCTKTPIVESDDDCIFGGDGDDEWAEKQFNDVQTINKKSIDSISNVSAEDDNFEKIGLNSAEYDPKHNLRINTKSKRSNHPI